MSANYSGVTITGMKICSKCHLVKPESAYFVKDKVTGRLHAQCKACYKAHRQTYYAEHYAKYKEAYRQRAKLLRLQQREEFRHNMLQYLSNKHCIECKESDVRVLELDHIDPKQKQFSISQAVRLGHKWNEVLTELEKCQVLCANCHKKRTAQQFNWYKSL